jgi:hypothetical protein
VLHWLGNIVRGLWQLGDVCGGKHQPGWGRPSNFTNARRWFPLFKSELTGRFCRRLNDGHLPNYLRSLSAGEARFDVREPHIVGPAVGADLDVMATAVIPAIDQHIADAGNAHSPKVIFCG